MMIGDDIRELSEETAEEIYAEVKAIEDSIPHLTAGGIASLAPWERDELNEISAAERLLRDDVYERGDESCARNHLADMREAAERFLSMVAVPCAGCGVPVTSVPRVNPFIEAHGITGAEAVMPLCDRCYLAAADDV